MTYQQFFVGARLHGLAKAVRQAVLAFVPFDLCGVYVTRFLRETSV